MNEKIVSEDLLRLKEYEEMYPQVVQMNKELRREVLEKDAENRVLKELGSSAPKFLTVAVTRDLSRLRLYDGSKVLKGTYLCYMDRWNAWFDVVVRGRGRASDSVKAPYFKLIQHADGYGTR